MLPELEFQPPWLVRLIQVLTGVLVTANLVLIVAAQRTVPRTDPSSGVLESSPAYNAVWSAYWWIQLPLAVMAIACVTRRQVRLGIVAILVLLLGAWIVIGGSPGAS